MLSALICKFEKKKFCTSYHINPNNIPALKNAPCLFTEKNALLFASQGGHTKHRREWNTRAGLLNS